MYKVYCDGTKIYDSHIEGYEIFNANLELELNKVGAFNFEIYPTHHSFYLLSKMKSLIEVYQDDYLIFKGRILDDEQGFYNEKQVVCEGELAFLFDSIIRPYEFEGTPEEYLEKLIDEHNAQVEETKQFKLGIVTITDGDTTNADNKITRSDTEYKTTWDLITAKLINLLGGYIWVRHETDGTYIDYLEDFDILSNQKIELGKNLLDITKTSKGADIASAIIPLGGSGDSKLVLDAGEEEKVVEGTENDIWQKADFIYSKKAVEKYGWITKVVTFSDTEIDEEHLLKNGVEELQNAINIQTTIELTAADLAHINDVNPFRLGRYITVKSNKHDLDSTSDFLIKKLNIDLLNPANNKLTVGTTISSFTEKTIKDNLKTVERVDIVEQQIKSSATKDDINNAVVEVTEQNVSSIEQNSTDILMQVSQDYYLKEDAEALVSSINTQFTQTNDEFEFRFNTFSQEMSELANDVDAKFIESSKYIRFVSGSIVLGEEGNNLILKLQNDRMSFLENDNEIAYISNQKFYITDGEITNSLKMGKFAFIPRANGNLSFKKVVD